MREPGDHGEPRDLRALYAPRSVAVVGASPDTAKWGGDIAARLARGASSRDLYFVNRRGGSLHGRALYPSLSDLPEAPELVIVATPAAAFEAVMEEALAGGVKAFVGIFAGLGERGTDGSHREAEAVRRIRAAGAVLLGPNCMGLADHGSGFEAVAYLDIPAGDVAFVSQSGAMGEEYVMRAVEWGCGFSRYVTVGNQADVSVTDVLAGLADHAPTRVVAVYAEDLGDGRAFAAAAAAVVSSGRPVVLLAPGRSAAGARAARSHTGSLAPAAAAVDALCAAAGVHRAETPRELFELAMALRTPARTAGRRVAVVSDGGGPGGVAADALAAAGLTVPEFAGETIAALGEALPGSAGTNPVDFALGTIEPDAYARVVPVVAAADGVDAVFAVGQLGYWSARFPGFEDLAAAEVVGAGQTAEAARTAGVPLVVSTVYPESPPAARLRELGVPVYREVASGLRALQALAEDTRRQAGVPETPPAAPPLTEEPDYWEARELLAAAGVAFAAAVRAETPEQARHAAERLGGEVVLKALGVLHKTEAGAVVTDLKTPEAVERAAKALIERLHPRALVVEAQAPVIAGVELIVGCRRDPVAGPLALAGAGGVLAEVLRDARVALAPVTQAGARELLRDLRVAALLDGVRGRPPLDADAAADALVTLSLFAAAHPEIGAVEINPLLVLPRGVLALDARIVLHDDEDAAGGVAAGRSQKGVL